MRKKLHSAFSNPRDMLIVPLDGIKSLAHADEMVSMLSPHVGWFKVGFETIAAFGPQAMINIIRTYKAKTFLDIKLHDIPNTVGNAAQKISELGIEMFNIHCSSGGTALLSAVEKKGNTILLGVTVLTSLDVYDVNHIYNVQGVDSKVLSFANDALDANLDGVICSPRELHILSQFSNLSSLLKITPGIQPEWFPSNDQKRVMTPSEAVLAGADGLVIGRAITAPPKDSIMQGDSILAVKAILTEIDQALAQTKA